MGYSKVAKELHGSYSESSSKKIDVEAQSLPPMRSMPLEESISTESSWHSRLLDSRTLPWFLFLAVITLNILAPLMPPTAQNTWTETDFAPAREAISETIVRFSSSLDWLDTKSIYRISNKDEPVYVGNGTDVDDNWDQLSLTPYNDLEISASEAKQLRESPLEGADRGEYKIEIGVFHNLHCLNMLRKRIYSDLHPETLQENAKIHIDHCIEALREQITCSGDMTPLPLKWSQAGNRWNPDFAVEHSCRNYGKLREWLRERAEG